MTQLPDKFKLQVAQLLGQEEADGLCRALLEEPTVSVRVNRAKAGCPPQDVENERVPWCETGYYLSSRPSFTLDPLFHAGTYYVQEASSMFIEQAFKTMDFQPQRMLDLCAAPGGKSTLWRSLLPDGALLVANEPIRQRAMILLENLTKWGHPDVVVTNAYPEDFAPLRGFFDVVATDVPCSGEGMFRKEEKAVEDWSLEAVNHCAARQWQIVCDIWPALREGGYLVYSTCTFNREETKIRWTASVRNSGRKWCRCLWMPRGAFAETPPGGICQFPISSRTTPAAKDSSWRCCVRLRPTMRRRKARSRRSGGQRHPLPAARMWRSGWQTMGILNCFALTRPISAQSGMDCLKMWSVFATQCAVFLQDRTGGRKGTQICTDHRVGAEHAAE